MRCWSQGSGWLRGSSPGRAAHSPWNSSPLAALGLSAAAAQADPVPSFRAATAGEPNRGLRVVPLSIETQDGRTHRYRIELAETPAQQERGMMFRREMAADTGMLFPMRPPRPAAFWMRNTFIPLDIIFIGADGRVRNIAERAKPLSDAPIPSDGPVAAVLELKAGEAARIGLRPGDPVRWGDAALGGAGRPR
jgi:uncharacterized membrane protein (UPF0127 family)